VGLDANVCVDRFSRLSTYGLGEGSSSEQVKWDDVNWGILQTRCVERNAARYQGRQDKTLWVLPSPAQLSTKRSEMPRTTSQMTSKPTKGIRQLQPRSAVLLRTSTALKWTESHRQYVRSMIMELALHSGAEYHVFLLVNVESSEYDLHEVADLQRVKDDYIPKEFHDLTIFFNEALLGEWYPNVEEHR
jgi:hypothetical protein